MNEWMKTRNDRNGDRVWKCTSVNDPCLQAYLKFGGLKWRKMEKKILGIHKCELLGMTQCELLGIWLCELLGIHKCELLVMTQLRIIRYMTLRIIRYT